jgi:hypothetical protein
LAAGCCACFASAAAAADKTPTFGEMLKASGIEVSGYLDVALNSLSTDTDAPFTGRVFDTEHHGFMVNAVDVTVSRPSVAEPDKRLGWFLQADAGSDAGVFCTNSTCGDDFEIQEAWFDYKVWYFNIMAGKFATLAGAEVIESPQNTNYSRSLLFGYAIPFTHTGLRFQVSPGDAWKFTAGVHNGWDTLQKSASTPPAPDALQGELGFSMNPAKWMSFAFAWYYGTANTAATGQAGDREVYDFVVTLKPMEDLSFVLNYDMGKQEKAAGATFANDAEWDGWAAYLNYTVTEGLYLSLRAEQFNDTEGFRTGTGPSGTGVVPVGAELELEETTFTIGVPGVLAKNLDLRVEWRQDKASHKVWMDAGAPSDEQSSYALEAIVKF